MVTLEVSSIESLSTKDGDGTRCVVFLQGCPLRCVYCHNIETWSLTGGEKISVKELTRKVLRYKPYFCEKGGVTISGGEPLVQSKPLISFMTELRKHKVNIALDTSGAIFNENVKKVIALADHILLDLKFPSDETFKKYTGGKLANTLKFLEECSRQKKRIWIRIVVVPGINDNEEMMKEYLALLKGHQIEKIGLLPFHTLGFEKFEKMGIENPLKEKSAMDIKRCKELQEFVNAKR